MCKAPLRGKVYSEKMKRETGSGRARTEKLHIPQKFERKKSRNLY